MGSLLMIVLLWPVLEEQSLLWPGLCGEFPKNGYFSLIIRKQEECLHLPQSVTNVKAYSAFSSDGSDYYSSFVLLLHWITPKAIMRKSDGSN